MPKSWSEKIRNAKPAHKVVLDKAFGGLKAGQTLFVTSPTVVEAYMRGVPHGEVQGIRAMRTALAAAHGADGACPITSSVHARMLAEVAIEALAVGVPADKVTPFWRVIEADSDLGKKLSIGSAGLRKLQASDMI